jgi:hypothetical protein
MLCRPTWSPQPCEEPPFAPPRGVFPICIYDIPDLPTDLPTFLGGYFFVEHHPKKWYKFHDMFSSIFPFIFYRVSCLPARGVKKHNNISYTKTVSKNITAKIDQKNPVSRRGSSKTPLKQYQKQIFDPVPFWPLTYRYLGTTYPRCNGFWRPVAARVAAPAPYLTAGFGSACGSAGARTHRAPPTPASTGTWYGGVFETWWEGVPASGRGAQAQGPRGASIRTSLT